MALDTDFGPSEDVTGQAGNKVVQWASIATMAAEAIAQVAASTARQQAVADARAAAEARASHAAAHGQARATWAPMLDERTRGGLNLQQTGVVWATAQGWRPEPEAERASALAEDRLRTLRPDVMERYDRLRAQGAGPVEAMTRVAPYFDRPADRDAREGAAGRRPALSPDTRNLAAAGALVLAVTDDLQPPEARLLPTPAVAQHPSAAAPAQASPVLQQPAVDPLATVAGVRQHEADVHALRTVRHEATPDDPATTRVDEHRAGVGMAVPERQLAAAEGAQAAAAARPAAPSTSPPRRTRSRSTPAAPPLPAKPWGLRCMARSSRPRSARGPRLSTLRHRRRPERPQPR